MELIVMITKNQNRTIKLLIGLEKNNKWKF
jgi:hypothetical protein